MLGVDARVTVDLGDVAPLDVPVRRGVRRHLPLEVHLDTWHTVDHSEVLQIAAAERPFGELVPAQIDVVGAGAQLVVEMHLVEFQVETVGHEANGVFEHAGVFLQHCGHPRIIHREPEADLVPGFDGVVARHVDRLLAQDPFDLSDVGRMHDGQDLCEPRIHAGAVERGSAAFAGLGDQLAFGASRRVWVVGDPVVAGDPVGGGDEVDARFEDGQVDVEVGKDPVEGDAVGLGGDEFVDRGRCDDADRFDSDDLAGVASDLVGGVAVQRHQLEVGLVA